MEEDNAELLAAPGLARLLPLCGPPGRGGEQRGPLDHPPGGGGARPTRGGGRGACGALMSQRRFGSNFDSPQMVWLGRLFWSRLGHIIRVLFTFRHIYCMVGLPYSHG